MLSRCVKAVILFHIIIHFDLTDWSLFLIQNFLESVGDYLTDICYLACTHKVKLEPAFINAALACEIMEGIASKLYPTMLVQNIALPMVFKAEVMHGLKEMKKKSSFF